MDALDSSTSSASKARPSFPGLAIARQAAGDAEHLALWQALLWEVYLAEGAPLGPDEADCRRWWEDYVAEADTA